MAAVAILGQARDVLPSRLVPRQPSRWGGIASLLIAGWTLCAWAPVASASARPQEDEDWGDVGWEEEDWTPEEDESGRSFLYRELVLGGFLSSQGLRGIPPGDPTVEHLGLSPRPPANYLGFDYVRTFPDSDPINRRWLPDWLPLTALDLHPRLVYDRLEPADGLRKLTFAPQDFWVRLDPGHRDRLSVLLGQFVLPYGVNPPFAPRQSFLLPVESTDLGLKWDWGISVKGPLGPYDWQIAATIGSGEALHSPHLFAGSSRSSHLVTARIGTPTYWDLQYGLSVLYGELPMIRAASVLMPTALSRWRIGLDGLYKYGTYLLAGAQLTYGQDGFRNDAAAVPIPMGETADVLGYRGWVDWVLPAHQDWRVGFQAESVIRDVGTPGSDDTALILETRYSISNSSSLMLDYRAELNRSMGEPADALFLTYVYYAN